LKVSRSLVALAAADVKSWPYLAAAGGVPLTTGERGRSARGVLPVRSQSTAVLLWKAHAAAPPPVPLTPWHAPTEEAQEALDKTRRGKINRREFLQSVSIGATWAGGLDVAGSSCAGPLAEALGASPAPQAANLSETVQTLKVGASEFSVRVVGDADSPFRYVVLHGDEETAPLATEAHLKRHPGVMIQLVNPRKRSVTFKLPGLPYTYDFDPNRIFTRAGIEKNVRALNRRTRPSRFPRLYEEVERFRERLLQLILGSRPPDLAVIAVHNNSTSPRSDFSFETFVNSRGYFPGVEAMQYQRGQSPFNLFIVTESAMYDGLARRGLNVVLENAQLAHDDGSLSVFCGREGIRYANIETRQGELSRQIEMLDTVREIWASHLPSR
jgi:hypothetical protein